MLIGIVGDTHNNLKNISKICEIFNSLDVQLVIHTGDITLPKSLNEFKSLEMALIGVFGNNDQGEKEDLLKTSKEFECKLYDNPLYLEFDKIKICVVHDPKDIDENILKNSNYIFHGHTHRYRLETLKGVTFFNPGECAGFMEGKNKIGLFDSSAKSIKTISF